MKFEVTYVLANDLKSLITLTYIPHPNFDGHEGRLSLEQSTNVRNFIANYPVPQFNEKLDGWYDFKNQLNKELEQFYENKK